MFVFLFVDPPTLNKTLPQNETLCLHKNVTLQCTASSGFPAPWLTLYNGSRILAKTNLSKLSHPITVSSAGDFKQYHCKASNLVGFDTVNISVNPAGELQFYSANATKIMPFKSCYVPSLVHTKSSLMSYDLPIINSNSNEQLKLVVQVDCSSVNVYLWLLVI